MTDTLLIEIALEVGTDLSSRSRAADVRRRILDHIGRTDGMVRLDLNGVQSMSESFADELFAVLAVIKGEEWFRAKLAICNHSSDVRLSILRALNERLSRQEQMQ